MINNYLGYDNKARTLNRAFVGVNGKARLCKKGYVGVNGKATLIHPHYNIEIPSVSGSYIYDGSEKSAVITNYDPNQVAISGTTKATSYGQYNITFSLKPPFTKWKDGSSGNKTGQWEITTSSIDFNYTKYENYDIHQDSGGTLRRYSRLTFNCFYSSNHSIAPNAEVWGHIYNFRNTADLHSGNIFRDYDSWGHDQYWSFTYDPNTGQGIVDINNSTNYSLEYYVGIVIKAKDNYSGITYSSNEINLRCDGFDI